MSCHSILAWARLRPLENPSYNRKFLSRRLHADPIDRAKLLTATFQLAAYMRQARGYFEDADRASLRARPLLIYYGLLHLAKCAILIAAPGASEGGRGRQHGLASRHLSHSGHSSPDFWDVDVTIQKHGVFLNFSSALAAISQVHTGDGQAILSDFPGIRFSMHDLWACIPEASEWLSLCGRDSRVGRAIMKHGPSASGYQVAREWVQRSGLTTEEAMELLEHFDYSKKLKARRDPASDQWIALEGCADADLLRHTWSCLPRPNEPLYLCAPPLPTGHMRNYGFPEPLVQFALFFVLSMLSRYDALLWQDIVMDESGIEHMLVERLCEVVSKLSPGFFADLYETSVL